MGQIRPIEYCLIGDLHIRFHARNKYPDETTHIEDLYLDPKELYQLVNFSTCQIWHTLY